MNNQILNKVISYFALMLILAGCGGDTTTSEESQKVITINPSVTLSSDMTTVLYNESVIVSWKTTDVENCIADGFSIENVESEGSQVVGPLLEDTTLSLNCFTTAGVLGDAINISISNPPEILPSVTISTPVSSVPFASSVTINWSASNADECVASGSWSGSKPNSGSFTITSVSSNSTYNLECSNQFGSVSQSASVDILPFPSIAISASPSTVSIGGTTTVNWTSDNSSTCIASDDWSGPKPANGSQVMDNLTVNKTYSLSCSGDGGMVNNQVNVVVTASPSVSLTATPSSVVTGSGTTLSWNSANTTSCIASGDWSGTKGTSGSQSISSINVNKTYNLNCTGSGGSASDTVNVTVLPLPTLSLTASPTSVTSGGSTTLSWSSSNATSCTASGDWSGTKGVSGSQALSSITANKTYNLNCTGSGGSTNDSVSVTLSLPLPSITITASPSSITSGESTTLSWSSSNATSCTASVDWSGSKGTSGTELMSSITANSTFSLQCSNTTGSQSGSVNVTVSPVQSGTALISWTSPLLNTDNSTLTDLTGFKFYYGTLPGNYTKSLTVNSPGISSFLIENLSSTTWYFSMTAYNSTNVESVKSAEVSKTIP